MRGRYDAMLNTSPDPSPAVFALVWVGAIDIKAFTTDRNHFRDGVSTGVIVVSALGSVEPFTGHMA